MINHKYVETRETSNIHDKQLLQRERERPWLLFYIHICWMWHWECRSLHDLSYSNKHSMPRSVPIEFIPMIFLNTNKKTCHMILISRICLTLRYCYDLIVVLDGWLDCFTLIKNVVCFKNKYVQIPHRVSMIGASKLCSNGQNENMMRNQLI